MTTPVVVAIDGPAGSGKSTVAKGIADALGLSVLDTGSMYRAITAIALRHDVDPSDAAQVTTLAETCELVVDGAVVVDGLDVTSQLRSPEVNGAVSVVAAHPGVRTALVQRQRVWVRAHGGGVVEGRDIGTVVFPDATVKVFLTASDDERARRRALDEQPDSVARRDRLDKARTASPLQAAADAHVIDTTGRDPADVVAQVVGWL